MVTNAFDASGNFESAVPVAGGELLSFYMLQVGGELPIAPFITKQPTNVTALVGENAPFSVLAGGSDPLFYQWSFDGSPIPGATSSVHAVTGVDTNDAGDFWVVITNSAGAVTGTPGRR